MKKLLLPIIAVMVCAFSVMAQTTITFSEKLAPASGTALQLDGQTVSDFAPYSFSFAANGGGSKPIYYASGNYKEIRLYAKNQMTVKSGEAITKIVFNLSEQGLKRQTSVAASVGTVTESAGVCEWNGSATEVTFTVGDKATLGTDGVTKAGQLDFGSVVITGGGGTIGPDPVPVVEEVENIAAFIAKADNANPVVIKGAVTAVFQNGNSLYVKDNSGWLQIFGATGQTYKNGDVIPGGIKGTFTLYGNDVPEMAGTLEGFQAGTPGTPVEPEVVIVDDINAEPINSYVEIRGATIANVSGKSATISDGGSEFPIYNNANITLTAGTNLTVRGFVASFRGTPQLTPSEILTSTGREIVATPTFSVASGEVLEGTKVEIKCATEGATIYYTLDESNPTADSEVYNAAIEITADVTIKAMAVKEGMDDSSVATAAYTIKVASKNEATFNFAEPKTLTPAYEKGIEEDNANTYVNTNDVVFTAQGIKLTAVGGKKADGSDATPGRLYFQSSGAVQLRVYNFGILTITAPEGNKITKLDFAFNNTSGANLNGGDNSVTVSGRNGVFEPAAAVESVVFTAKGSVQINSITVTCENELSGVEDVIAENDANAPVEYYNINGVRVNNPSNGLYIVRQGNKVSKVIIR